MTANKGYHLIDPVVDEYDERDQLIEELDHLGNPKPLTKKKKSKIYFGSQTQKNIELYLEEENPIKKELIFTKSIYPKIRKLVENIVFMGFNNIRNEKNSTEELISEVVSFLVIKGIPTYDPAKGRAFSYFTKIARNYLVGKLKYETRYVNINESDEDDDDEYTSYNKYSYNEKIIERAEEAEEGIYGKEFLFLFKDMLKENQYYISEDQKDIKVIDTLIDIIEQYYEVTNISFKSQVIGIIQDHNPELSEFQIKNSLKKIEKFYVDIKDKYIENRL
jgi:hypothetical protein